MLRSSFASFSGSCAPATMSILSNYANKLLGLYNVIVCCCNCVAVLQPFLHYCVDVLHVHVHVHVQMYMPPNAAQFCNEKVLLALHMDLGVLGGFTTLDLFPSLPVYQVSCIALYNIYHFSQQLVEHMQCVVGLNPTKAAQAFSLKS